MRKKLLLIGWDAADWRLLNPLLDSGELPALNQIVEGGVAGDLLACQPLSSAAQWTSVATGKRPWQHGVLHSREFDSHRGQSVPIRAARCRCSTIWEILAQHNLVSVVVGLPATHGTHSEHVQLVSDRYSEPTAGPGIKPWPPATDGTYSSKEMGKALDPLRVSPEDLGADVISRYMPNWKRVDQKRDRRIGQLRMLLSSDLSHYNAATHLLQHEAWDFAAVRFPALGHIARLFLPFQQPRRSWIDESDFEIYRDVVRIELRVLDQFLGTLRQSAGIDNAVMLVSTHGVQSPNVPPAGFPPGEDAWKSSHGIVAVSGPGFLKDQLIHGASVLDVTPTILHWLGFPIGDDMEGRVLLESFAEVTDVYHVPSWDSCDASSPLPIGGLTATHPIAKNILQETQWNYVQSLLEAGRTKEALEPLQALFRSFPERPEFSHALFQCQLNQEQLHDAEETLEVLLESLPPGPAALLARAELAIAKREVREARRLAIEIRKANLAHPALLRRFGILLLRLREWDALAELARAAIALDENEPLAWLGLAEAMLRRSHAAEAEEAARRAIQLKYFLPDAHFILARALVAQNKWNEARETMSGLMKLQPWNKTAAGYNRRIAHASQSA
jgi:Tfp pilus assembly protein PilF